MKATHLFLESDFRCRHNGLIEMARKKGVTISAMAPGTSAFFFNRALDKVMVLSPNGVLAYARFPKGITCESLNAFPSAVTPGTSIVIPKTISKKIFDALGVTDNRKGKLSEVA